MKLIANNYEETYNKEIPLKDSDLIHPSSSQKEYFELS
jgi:hypothetical protein